MRSDKYKKGYEYDSKKKGGFAGFTRKWAVLYALITIAVAAFVLYADILDVKTLLIGLGIMAVLFLLTFPALFFRSFKKSRRILAFLLSLIITAGYGLGAFYLGATLGFFSSITSIGASVEEYYVLVRDDDTFDKLEDIQGQTVVAYENGDGFAQAEEKLLESVSVNFENAMSLSDATDGLLSGEHDVIFINAANYETTADSNETFEDSTKILEKIRVRVENEDISKRVNVTKKPFNVYISGLDVSGSIGVQSRSDVNMIATVNPETKKILLTSIPRDYYVEFPNQGGAWDKLTHSGIYGIDDTIAAVENLTGIEMNYYAKVNYTTVETLVDAIGGITVHSDYTFVTHGMSVYYQFYEGDNEVNGSQALAFARERKSFPDGDLQRNRNQQEVLKAILNKVLSSSTLLTKYTSILSSIEDNVELNMSAKDIKALVKMQLKDMSGWDIETQGIIGAAGYEPSYASGGAYASVVLQDEESIREAVNNIKRTMGIEVTEEAAGDGTAGEGGSNTAGTYSQTA